MWFRKFKKAIIDQMLHKRTVQPHSEMDNTVAYLQRVHIEGVKCVYMSKIEWNQVFLQH